MSPANPHVATQLRQLIYYHLDANLLRNALFFASRLQANEPKSSEAAFLIALCHFRLGQFKAAYESSKIPGSKGTHLGCSYTFAQACLELQKYEDGISALDRSKGLWAARNGWNKHTDTRRQYLPDAAAVNCLRGKLWQAHNDTNRAVECYAEALKLNPFMWDAFLSLCDLGVNVRIPNIFKMTLEMTSGLITSTSEETPLGILDDSPTSSSSHGQASSLGQQLPSNDPFSISKNRVNGDNRLNQGSSALYEKLNGSTTSVTPMAEGGGFGFEGLDTPTGPGESADTNGFYNRGLVAGGLIAAEPPLAPMRKVRTLQGHGIDFSTDAPPRMKTATAKSNTRTKTNSEDVEPTAMSGLPTLSTSASDRKRTVSGQAPQAVLPNATAASNTAANDPMGPQRRSVRLFNQIRPQRSNLSAVGSVGAREGREIKKVKATGTKGRSANVSTVGRVVSGNRKHGDPMETDAKETRTTSVIATAPPNSKPPVNDKVREREALLFLLDLFTKLGSGYFALSHYQCQDAIQIFSTLPPAQKDTPWVLAQLGRAFYERASYAEAEKYYGRIRAIAPARLEDMEIYSTILWHLKNEIELTFLAHEIIDVDRLSPQAWCAVGNSFSLQRDHDQALKCFRRAVQLDPTFAYAFTLQGHEHIANEEYDKALSAYRSSIAAEHRHYNAWYGLGKVFEKQGKFDMAESHYRIAASINPTNSALVCCIGVVLEKMRNPKAALLQYARSCDLAPKSTLARYRKAVVLITLQQPQLALAELKVLKDIVPDESNVHFQLGKVYKTLRQKGNAIKHFTIALNLDPKASHTIKEAMEQMEDEDEEDAQMM
ncbi:anaphase-promoting complex subunit cdc27 [Loxospora ochrophaea]|nr:anaphase-promoting complex subunit cdc27 [Loxospora ochrophaea]